MKPLLACILFSSLVSAAVACPAPTCNSTSSGNVSSSVGITGNISNTINSGSQSFLGSGGGSFATSTAAVTESASATGGGESTSGAPNGSIYGATSTHGSASVTGFSATIGNASANTSGIAYGTAIANVTGSLTSTSSGGSLTLGGDATSTNQVGVGYGTQSANGGVSFGGVSVTASSGNAVTASGLLNSCTVPTNGTISDSKSGYTLTNAPVTNTYSSGNADGGAFSPFTNGSTSTATQSATVTGSFVGK